MIPALVASEIQETDARLPENHLGVVGPRGGAGAVSFPSGKGRPRNEHLLGPLPPRCAYVRPEAGRSPVPLDITRPTNPTCISSRPGND